MSTKRKSDINDVNNGKRNRKSKDEEEESDRSENGNSHVEVLIPSDELDNTSKLPEDLLKTYEKGSGQLLIAGMVTWDLVGKRDAKKVAKVRPNLYSFNKFTDAKYKYIASGCAAAHNIVVNTEGQALTFGRNPFGQLGQSELKCYEKPTLVPGLENLNIIQAAAGRNHTLFLSDNGTVYACGDNKSGQCGIGNTQPIVQNATRINYRGPPIVRVACGAEFSAILDIKGNLYTFGLPEYGQLGHNTDGKYFVTANKLTFHFETSPKKVLLYIEKTKEGHITPVENVSIVDIACGSNHTIAIDSKKRVYSWGFGGFGRLGHAEQKDEMVPRLIKMFDSQGRGVTKVFCGSSFSLAITDIGQLYLFGQNKKTGEANMYPKPVQDLAGWNITDVGCSYTSIVISADDTLISWGASPTYGELGLGDMQKSSTTPKEVTKCEGMKIPQVTMGQSHSLLLVDTSDEKTKEKYEKFVEFDPDD
ncbi:protein RCC2 homolog [Condylostylus longicornis]|uniref:protein RCC2 homolog n=1 Tax=Condylostylus longicornis TaxID=2530218 RepID=UPI00244E0A06|nr:protein RCC2 homolog [Condylostylus longicornis]